MTIKDILKGSLPHILAIVFFLLVAVIYTYPVLEGKKIFQSDVAKFKGMSKEIVDFRQEYDEEPLWTNSMFGGMPAYMISTKWASSVLNPVRKALALWLPHPTRLIFLLLLGFYVLLNVMRVKPLLSVGGSLAFAFSTYFIIIIAVGHNTKTEAMAYLPFLVAGIMMVLQRKYLWGGIVTALFVTLEIMINHLQITYYGLIIILIWFGTEFVRLIMKKEYRHIVTSLLVLLAAGIIGVMINFNKLYTVYRYTDETTRGPSELVAEGSNQTSGLDKDYITAWSYGKQETFTLLIPNAKGGGDAQLAGNETAMEAIPREYRQVVGGLNQYWGDQPFTAGPVYVGALVIFLFVLSFLLLKGPLRWVMLAATILAILLSWGKNMMWFTDIFIDYVPGYAKFRTVTMVLVIAQFCIPLLAFVGLNKALTEPGVLKDSMKKFWIALGITGGFTFLAYLAPGLFFDFLKTSESQEFTRMMRTGNNADQIALIVSYLEDARIAIFKADALRSLVYIILGAAVIWLFASGRLKQTWAMAAIVILVGADMLSVNKRYLDSENFVSERVSETPFPMTQADRIILEDESQYRVLNLAVSTFNDGSTSYYHHSIGGYHGSKPGRYQEMIDYHLGKEINQLRNELSSAQSVQPGQIFRNTPVLNMLNAKYVIVNPEGPPIRNPYAAGNAWFIDRIEVVENANREIELAGTIDPEETAIVHERYTENIESLTFAEDSLAGIRLVSYKPNHLVYESNTSTEQFAVFSENYYDLGWQAYIDGEEVPHVRVNYLLRGMVVPAGEHTIEFRFEPADYYNSAAVSYIFAGILLLWLLAGIAYEIIKRRKATVK